mgnify:CR=1 FL=1
MTAAISKIEFGSISHGTLRHEDLIPCFIEYFEEIATSEKFKLDVIGNLIYTDYHGFENVPESYWDSEDAQFDLEALFDAINEVVMESLPYSYFGAHEGDGSDFGVWFDSESFELARGNEEIIDRNDLDKMPSYFCEVNDHGNVTLFSQHMEVIFSIV